MTYTIDGIDFKNFGVFVSASKGIVNRPKMKSPTTISWDNYHGNAVDLTHKYMDVREITLQCFIKADGIADFIQKVMTFESVFDKEGTNRLAIAAQPDKPLIYEVYCESLIDIDKVWDDKQMVGTFALKLIEPDPVKRVLCHTRTGNDTATCTIRMSTANKCVNIHWGDGTVNWDVVLDNQTIAHTYNSDGVYYPVIAGDIDRITDFSTNAQIVWNKL